MYRHFKRALDLLVSILLIILTLPISLVIGIVLTVSLRGNPIFSQNRPGKNEKIFRLYKFRTMTNSKDELGQYLPDELRMTRIGSFIRKLSLDELPQLINVILGHMSLVGPRPLLVEYIPLYNDFQKRRHEVKPGITGWAQVNGRNTLTWQKKFEYDVWYVNHCNMMTDLKILFLTLIKVLKKEGISSSTSVTMQKFKGNK